MKESNKAKKGLWEASVGDLLVNTAILVLEANLMVKTMSVS